MLNPATIKIVIAVASLVALVGKGLLTNDFDLSSIADILGGLGLGAALLKRPGDEKAAS